MAETDQSSMGEAPAVTPTDEAPGSVKDREQATQMLIQLKEKGIFTGTETRLTPEQSQEVLDHILAVAELLMAASEKDSERAQLLAAGAIGAKPVGVDTSGVVTTAADVANGLGESESLTAGGRVNG